jgi:hypothetical protein
MQSQIPGLVGANTDQLRRVKIDMQDKHPRQWNNPWKM